MRKIVFAVILGLVGGLSLQNRATAQPPTKTELQKDKEDLIALDPDIEQYLPRWRILEADLKAKLTLYFRSKGVPMRTSDTITVTASFPDAGSQDLLKIRAGSYAEAELNGRAKIESELGTELYQEILSKKYKFAEIEPAKPLTENETVRTPSVLNPPNARQFIAVSAFRQAIQLGTTGARLEHVIGNDEIGYHFWSAGQGKVLIDYPIIRLQDPDLRANGLPDILKVQLGVGYRLKFGYADDNVLSDLVPSRLLNGALGAKAIVRAEYRLPQVNDIGVAVHTELPMTKLTGSAEVDGTPEVVWAPDRLFVESGSVPIRSAYFLRTIAQGQVFWENWFDNYEHYFRIGVGVSYQDIAHGALVYSDGQTEGYVNHEGDATVQFDGRRPGPRPSPVGHSTMVKYLELIHPTKLEEWIYLKAEYLNQSGFPFGASAQLANRNLLLTGFIPVIPNWLFLEAKYSTPLFPAPMAPSGMNNPAPWEQKSFVMISPILRFKLD